MAYSLSRNEPIRAWMLEIQKDFNVDTFVETGTRRGSGVTWAANNGFNPCYTIDTLDREPEGDFLNFVRDDVIFRHVGRSTDVLKDLLPWIDQPAIFWLDAHGPKDVGSPVLKELRLILARSAPSYIFIDDISIFARERFYTRKYSSWPWANAIYRTLGSRPYIERADVLIIYPLEKVDRMYDHWQRTRDIYWFMDIEDSDRQKAREGWWKPQHARKYHYYVKGASLCKDWSEEEIPLFSVRILGHTRCKRCLGRL